MREEIVMAMITCKECGKEFSDKADKCPNCAAPIEYSREFGVPYEAPPSLIKKKLSICLLISLIVGVLYLLYSVFYWSGAASSGSDAYEQIGAGIATALVMPHLIATFIAVIFNALGLIMKKRGFALAGAILYSVAMVLFPMYFMFVIIEVILSFIGYARTPKY